MIVSRRLVVGVGCALVAAGCTTKRSTPNALGLGGAGASVVGLTAVAATPAAGSSARGAEGSLAAAAIAGGSALPEVRTPEPTLVTSGPNAYWQEGKVAQAPGATPTLRVNVGESHQEWLGFGGTFNEAGWDALLLLEAAERERALRLLFHRREGAGFVWGRIPMGASDYSLSRYTLSETPGDYAMEDFSIARDKQRLIPYIQAALAVDSRVRLWASPWSPPAWMKDNNSLDGGRLRDDAKVLQAYALYFARFVEAYASEGLRIEQVQPQNEPGYETRYPSCLWTPQLLARFVGEHLGPTLSQRGLSTEIWFGTMSHPDDPQHLDAVMANATSAAYVKGFGLQWNTMASTGTLASRHGLPVMQTEHQCGNYHWRDSFNPVRPPNDHAYGEESWKLIVDWIQAGVNIYSAWNMVLDSQGHNLDEQRPWPQNALLVVDRDKKTLTATPAYHVFRHISQFVDPGARRVGTSGAADALAFKNPDGSVVAVLHNSGSRAQTTTLGVGEVTLQFQVPARGWATVNWQ